VPVKQPSDHSGRAESTAIGRKNWLFNGSDAGAERVAVIYSLVATCKLCHVDPLSPL